MHRQPWYQLSCYSVTCNFLLLKETRIDNTTNLLFCFNEAQQVHSVWLLLDRIYCKKLLLRKIYNSSIEVFHAIPKITFRSWGTANIVLGCTKKRTHTTLYKCIFLGCTKTNTYKSHTTLKFWIVRGGR